MLRTAPVEPHELGPDVVEVLARLARSEAGDRTEEIPEETEPHG
jgi:hypothetical protein